MAIGMFDGVEVISSVLTEAECKTAAVDGRFREVFGVDEDGVFQGSVEGVRA